MGGLSSGRRRIRNRAMVEQSLSLDIRQMRRRGYLRPGLCVSGHWTWICSPSGRSAGSISFVVNLTDPDAGNLELHFTLNGERQTQRIELEAAPCRFGGQVFISDAPARGAAARCWHVSAGNSRRASFTG